ncbi:hypothetical protein GCM10023144_24980 [Pigmentiphaga soli]|uniref:Protein kinase domain-containing protein n=1 Tax=Pigmentiphaga soli TaxID=1007095 RepID=A0ABP8H2T8_9BURK
MPTDGHPHNALPPGTQLAEFEILDLVGEGGFGIVYLADDTSLGRRVAVKEYMPSAIAHRAGGGTVSVKSARHGDTFEAGRRSFINEARLLARFDHPSLLKVYRFWEANGTAYMAMPFYEGATLKETLAATDGPPDEAWLRGLLAPLLNALAIIHGEHCYHRDIAPDNILLLKGSGRPLLLDFGAARRVIGGMTQDLTIILKPGYAPVEQYAEVPAFKQGPWTDLYALAAVVHFAIRGRTPPEAVGRVLKDSYVPLATDTSGRYSQPFLQAIDRALAVSPEQRPQSVQELAADLGIRIDAGYHHGDPFVAETGMAGTRSAAGALDLLAPEERDDATRILPSAPRTTAASASVSPASVSAASVPAASGPAPARPAASRKKWPLAAAAAGILVLAGLAAILWRPGASDSGDTAPASSGQPSQAASTAGPPDQANGAPAQPAQPGQTAEADRSPQSAGTLGQPNQATEQTSQTTPVPAAPNDGPAADMPPYNPFDELARLPALGDPAVQVRVDNTRAVARIGRDTLSFSVRSNTTGYLYVLMVDPAGKFIQLFPNGIDANHRIQANQPLRLPRPNWPMDAGEPAGLNRFVALVSATERDFTQAGLTATGDVFQEFPPTAQTAAARLRRPDYSPFAGQARCPTQTPCNPAWGAAAFDVQVRY